MQKAPDKITGPALMRGTQNYARSTDFRILATLMKAWKGHRNLTHVNILNYLVLLNVKQEFP